MNAKAKRDLYQEITDKVLGLMQEHGTDWVKPWTSAHNGLPYNVISGRPYKGTNSFLLSLEAATKGYGSNAWATFKQWQQRGAKVRKGERATTVILFKKLKVNEWDDDAEDYVTKQVPLIRGFAVFNADQVEGHDAASTSTAPDEDPHTAAADWVSNTGAQIHKAAQAFYVPSRDSIGIPPAKDFKSVESYYATLFHELTHWTGHQSRCDRQLKGRFNDEAYAMEELVAELGAAFQCIYLGVEHEPHPDHAKYINVWIKKLQQDKRAFTTAANKAQEAVDFLDSFQWEDETETELDAA